MHKHLIHLVLILHLQGKHKKIQKRVMNIGEHSVDSEIAVGREKNYISCFRGYFNFHRLYKITSE